jgi:uncharacterized protein involved in exopolysaccharide biosynthesis
MPDDSRFSRSSSAHGAAPGRSQPPEDPKDRPTLDRQVSLGWLTDLLARHLLHFALIGVVGAIVGAGIASLQPIVYEGRTKLMVVAPKLGGNRPATSVASFRELLENRTVAAQIIHRLRLDQPPYLLTSQSFFERAAEITELRNTTVLTVTVRLANPQLAARVANELAAGAIELSQKVDQHETEALATRLSLQLEQATQRLAAAESALLTYRREAQIELLKTDSDAMLDQRGGLPRLFSSIAGERARAAQIERELATLQARLTVHRSFDADPAMVETLRAQAGANSVMGVTLKDEYVNPVYEGLQRELAESRTRLAELEHRREELVDRQKVGGAELTRLVELYGRESSLSRLQSEYDLAKRVQGETALRFEQVRTEMASSSAQLVVLDEALPADRPLARGRVKWAVVGAIAALLTAFAIAVIVAVRRWPTPAANMV